MSPLLHIQSVSKSFGGLRAVDHCSFEVAENSITGLIGPNGAGKTTMFDVISGLLKPTAGKIIFKHEEISSLPFHVRARRGIVRTFQNIRLFPQLTALENIMVAFPDYPDRCVDMFRPLATHCAALKKRAHDLLALTKLHDMANHEARSLSYGQQKLVEILRCVATGATLLLLDEPTAGVNRTMLHHIVDLIKHLQKEGKTILLVEHDMNFVMNLCERIVVMDFGTDIAHGTPHEIQQNPRVMEAYLGSVKKAHHAPIPHHTSSTSR